MKAERSTSEEGLDKQDFVTPNKPTLYKMFETAKKLGRANKASMGKEEDEVKPTVVKLEIKQGLFKDQPEPKP